MSEKEASSGSRSEPRIEFPCPGYPVKILGVAGSAFREYVLNTVELHAPGFDVSRVSIRDSSKGSFQSITVFITATGEQQLSDLNDALRTSKMVKLVL